MTDSLQSEKLMAINQHQTNLNYIRKLLKCVAELEDQIGVNSPSFDLYRKVECMF